MNRWGQSRYGTDAWGSPTGQLTMKSFAVTVLSTFARITAKPLMVVKAVSAKPAMVFSTISTKLVAPMLSFTSVESKPAMEFKRCYVKLVN